jgi:hypothetical protein
MRLRPAIVIAVFVLFAAVARAEDKPQELILGKWKLDDPKTQSVIEFLKDGKLKVSAQDLTLDGSYRFIDDKTMEMKVVLGGKEETGRFKFTLTKDEFTTEETTKDGHSKKVMKRVK